MTGWQFLAGLWAGAAVMLLVFCVLFARYIAADMDSFTRWLEREE